ncbi:DUF6586 family protein [Marinobacter sp. SS5-14b]|uniref:DUF6586 family protein n=1 Tax=Marinobacter sp. SS5-14b TaxID=3050456 RepID=UPI0026DF6403|nr:DUF6586 family protein [Marinobacter sp. SS5-14b]
MASQWYSLVSQNLYMAKILLAQLEHADEHAQVSGQPPAALREALTQGATELLLRGRSTLLIMIARYHQQKHATPSSLAELKALIPYEVQEIENLELLCDDHRSWWNHLGQLERSMVQPAAPKKTVSAENIIAISAEEGPDRSSERLQQTLKAMAEFARALEDQHGEW